MAGAAYHWFYLCGSDCPCECYPVGERLRWVHRQPGRPCHSRWNWPGLDKDQTPHAMQLQALRTRSRVSAINLLSRCELQLISWDDIIPLRRWIKWFPYTKYTKRPTSGRKVTTLYITCTEAYTFIKRANIGSGDPFIVQSLLSPSPYVQLEARGAPYMLNISHSANRKA